MKKVFFALIFAFAVFDLFSQEIEDSVSAAEESADTNNASEEIADDDLLDLFDSAEDTDAVITDSKNSGEVTINAGGFSIPLTFSGYLESSVGAGDIWEDGKHKPSGYFTFLNYLYLNARPDKTLSIHGSLRTVLPSGSTTSNSSTDSILSVYELYFTYLLFDSVFITAGKKATSWGYVRLIGTSDDDSNAEDTASGSAYKYGGISTNIISDSRNGTSGLIRIPFWTGTISAIALYNESYGAASNMSAGKMSFALSVEQTFFKTSLNLFARKYPSLDKNDVELSESAKIRPVAGAEIKRTIFDADVYAQSIAQLYDRKTLVDERSVKGLGSIVNTVGLYKWWNKHDPNFGFNVEYQDVYFPITETHSRCMAYDVGLAHLGKKKNIKLGASGYHSFTKKNGYVKPGIIFSGLIPHATWENGVRVDYGESDSFVSPKITFGSYIKITLNY